MKIRRRRLYVPGVVLGVFALLAGPGTRRAAASGGTGTTQGPARHGTGIFEELHFLGKVTRGCIEGAKPGGPLAPILSNKGYNFAIKSVSPHQRVYDSDGPPPAIEPCEYVIEVKPLNQSQPAPQFCDGRPALAIAGEWTKTGVFIPPDEKKPVFTFACVPEVLTPKGTGAKKGKAFRGGGAIAKCIDWGYPPWCEDGSACDEMMNLFVACTHAAQGDYCGTNTPQTIDGTPILLFDQKNKPATGGTFEPTVTLTRDNPVAGTYYFEAAWRVGSKDVSPEETPTHRPARGIGGVAACLTKKRWQTYALGTSSSLLCAQADQLGPPHDPTDRRPEGGWDFVCDQKTVNEIENQGALLYSYSLFTDVGLWRFQRVDGASLTTTRVKIQTTTQATTRTNYSQVVPDDSLGVSGYTNPHFEGTVLQALPPWTLVVANNLRKLQKPDVVSLILCQKNGLYEYETWANSCPVGMLSSSEGLLLLVGPQGYKGRTNQYLGAPLFRGVTKLGGHIVTTTDKMILGGVPLGNLVKFLQ